MLADSVSVGTLTAQAAVTDSSLLTVASHVSDCSIRVRCEVLESDLLLIRVKILKWCSITIFTQVQSSRTEPEPILYKVLVSLGIQALANIYKQECLGTDRLSGVILWSLE